MINRTAGIFIIALALILYAKFCFPEQLEFDVPCAVGTEIKTYKVRCGWFDELVGTEYTTTDNCTYHLKATLIGGKAYKVIVGGENKKFIKEKR